MEANKKNGCVDATVPLIKVENCETKKEMNGGKLPLIGISSSTESLVSNHMFQGKESILSSQIEMCVDETKPKIPDGGWGWVVVFASFFINLVSDGVAFTFGLLYIEFLHAFGASKSATSWIGSLFMAVPLLAGPIGSALVDRYGCRSMTILGGLISTVGFTLSSFAQSILVMYLTFGVIGGLGLGLCYVTAVVSIAFWFEKKRTVALGLAASGTGFGTVIYSPLSTYLLGEYGWRGTILILSAIFANMCVCGLLMKDPEWILQEEKKSEKRLSKRKQRKKSQDQEYILKRVNTSLDLSKKTRFKSVINLPTYLKENEEVPLEVLKKLSNKKQLYNIILENYPNLLRVKSSSNDELDRLAADASLVTTRVPLQFSMKVKKKDKENKTVELKTKQPFHFHNYLKNIRFRKNSMGYRGAMLNIHKYKLKASSCPNILKNSMMTLEDEERDEKCFEGLFDILKDLTHIYLFNQLHFFLMNLSTIILYIWFIVPYFYLADHMKGYDYSEKQSSFVISVIGITNTIGMVVLGWLGDRIDATKTYAICLIFCGFTCGGMIIFTSTYILLVIFSGLFGLFFASCFSLTPSILAKLVPIEEFTMAYGLHLLCQGIGNLIGPPLAGLLFDLTQSWDQSFYQAGVWIMISGVLVGIIPFIENRRMIGRNKGMKVTDNAQLENLV